MRGLLTESPGLTDSGADLYLPIWDASYRFHLSASKEKVFF